MQICRKSSRDVDEVDVCFGFKYVEGYGVQAYEMARLHDPNDVGVRDLNLDPVPVPRQSPLDRRYTANGQPKDDNAGVKEVSAASGAKKIKQKY